MEHNKPMTSTGYGICTVDINSSGLILSADRGMEDMTGYSESELASPHFGLKMLLVNEERQSVFNHLRTETAASGMTCFECFLRHKSGRVMPVSCFAKSKDGGCIELVWSESEPAGESEGLNYDALTGFFCYDSAVEEIKRVLSYGSEIKHSCVLFKLSHLERLRDEYGNVFAGAAIENTAIYLKHEYSDKGRNVVMARISDDTFMVFQSSETPLVVKNIAAWAKKELVARYYGRSESVFGGVSVGICHMMPGDTFEEVMRNAEKALYYSERHGTVLEEYSPFRNYGMISSERVTANIRVKHERMNDYDTRFVAFAISLLENSKEENSSLDLLIQRIGWHFGMSRCAVGVYDDAHDMRITNLYAQGKGVVVEPGIIYDTDGWGDLIRYIDPVTGSLMVNDSADETMFGKNSSMLADIGIRSMMAYWLYDKNLPIGFVAFSRKEPTERWSEIAVNSLKQLSKIISLFVMKRARAEDSDEIYNRLSRDELTGLYIYPAFIERVRRAMYSYDPKKTYAIIYSDIDNFSYVNDNFGYEAGDAILKRYAARIHAVRSEEGIVCHVHGDKFMVFSVRESEEAITSTVERVNNDFYELKRREYPLSEMRITTGIYFINDPETDVIRAISNAVHIWKETKKDKYCTFGIYTEEFERKREHRLGVIGSVHTSIENGEIEAFLQPKFSMRTMEVVGAEALCRWRKPEGGYRMPYDFIPILEDARLIIDVDFCIFEQTLKTLAKWKADGKKLIPISVNFSRRNMMYDGFTDHIKSLTKSYGIEPKYIEIEITETAANEDSARMLEYMRELREVGFKVDIDDFGTGYSALNMLLNVPVDIVKVDKSIIDNYGTDSEKEYIDRVGKLIRTANKDIIFEGVETQEQLDFLVSCGYENAQGYIFSKPVAIREFEERYVY